MEPKITRREMLFSFISGLVGSSVAPTISAAVRDPKAPPPTPEDIKRDRVIGGVAGMMGALTLTGAAKGRFKQDTSIPPDLHRKREQDRRDAIRDAQEHDRGRD